MKDIGVMMEEIIQHDENPRIKIEKQAFLEAAITAIADKSALYDIHRNYSSESDISKYFYLFYITNEQSLENAILSLTKAQIEEIFFNIPRLLEIFNENKITPFIRLRYRKYMFRMLYLIWQDYYDKIKIRNLFLYALNHPKSVYYVCEVGFSVEQLRALALSNQIESKFVELARLEQLDIREFIEAHQINRDSVIAIDVMSIFFLFCSAKDYLDFGSERLIIAIMRFDRKNQAKMLNNMVRKLEKEERSLLNAVFQYFLYVYKKPGSEKDDEKEHSFWNLLQPDVLLVIQEEFMRQG